MRRLIRLILAFTMLGASFAVLQAQTDERQKVFSLAECGMSYQKAGKLCTSMAF
jgi:hypothetical protein